MGKYGKVSIRSVIRAEYNLFCAGVDCKNVIREGKPAVKEGKDIFCLGCAEKQGYRPNIPFEVEPDYVIVEGSSIERICADCQGRINPGATHFCRNEDGAYFCEKCGREKHGYKLQGSQQIRIKDPLKASKQQAAGGAKQKK